MSRLLDAAEEGLEGAVQPGQHILQDLGMHVVVLWPRLLDGWQFGALVGDTDTHATFLPGVAPFLERGIVQFPSTAHDKGHPLLLLWSRQQFVLEGFARCEYFHSDSILPAGYEIGKAVGHSSPA